MNKQNLLLAGAITCGVALSGYVLRLDRENSKPIPKASSGALGERTSQEYRALFDKVTPAKQKAILDKLDKHVMENTTLGKDISALESYVYKPVMKDLTLPEGHARYLSLDEKILYHAPGDSFRIGLYLRGVSPLMATAHEKLHCIMSDESPWKRFEKFCQPFASDTVVGAGKDFSLKMTRDQINEYCAQFIGGGASEEQAAKVFYEHFGRYLATRQERYVIEEVVAHSTFEPYYSASLLFGEIQRYEIYAALLKNFPKDRFDTVFNATMALLYLEPDPVVRGAFVGRNGISAANYDASVTKLAGKLAVTDARMRGIALQSRKLNELAEIGKMAESLIDNAVRN